MSALEVRRLAADLLIIGGGTAGCQAAVTARELAPSARVVIMEKAHVDRSGCLAAGVNALNAYLAPGEPPDAFVSFVKADFGGLVREDLVASLAARLAAIPPQLEAWGLPVPHAEDGGYLFRGPRSIVIHGEGLKPLLAAAARRAGAHVLNRVAATSYLVYAGVVCGACGFGLRDGAFYVVEAPAVICATGGATGLYPPCTGGLAHHRTWYSPFNTGAGYAMGLRAGAELTSLEQRFVPLRIKDVLAPTGTVAQGGKAAQVNCAGQPYLRGRGRLTTADRLLLTLDEERAGRGPCYLDLSGLTGAQSKSLQEAYLEMCPSVLLHWADRAQEPAAAPLEVTGSEPCVVGGHGQAGYWIGLDRATTLPGLFAAGDVAGGAPKKYVTGCLAEGQLAAEAALAAAPPAPCPERDLVHLIEEERDRVARPLTSAGSGDPRGLEARLQKIMEEYAGGRTTGYQVCEGRLAVAGALLEEAQEMAQGLKANDLHELLLTHEVLDRLTLASAVVEHLRYRKESRWPIYQTRSDFPARDDARWFRFVNSRLGSDGRLELVERPVTGEGREMR